jgi:hypothetical protein
VPRRLRLAEWLQTNTAAIVVAALLALGASALIIHDPARVNTVTIDNPTSYDVRVEASDGNGSGWTALGTARQQCASTIELPIDQGGTWVFRMSAQGAPTEEVAVDRSALEGTGWRFEITPTVGDAWKAAGVPQPPRLSC